MESTVEEYLMKKYEGVLLRVVRVKKEDLKMVSAVTTASWLNLWVLTSSSPTICLVIVGSIFNSAFGMSAISSPFERTCFHWR